VVVGGRIVERGKLYLDPKGGGSQVAIEVQAGRYTIDPEAGVFVGPYAARVVVYPDGGNGGATDPLMMMKMKTKAGPDSSEPHDYIMDVDIPAGAHTFDISFPGSGP